MSEQISKANERARRLSAEQKQLVSDYLWLVRDAAKHYRSNRILVEDLEQAGRLALVEAALRHPLAEGSFRLYAWASIHNAMLMLLRRNTALADRTHAIMVVCLGLTDEPMKPFTDETSPARELESLAVRAATARITGFTRYAEEVDPTDDPETRLARERLSRALHDTLAAMPAELSETIQSYFLEGRSLKQICSDQATPYITIRRRCRRALDALSAGLAARGYEAR